MGSLIGWETGSCYYKNSWYIPFDLLIDLQDSFHVGIYYLFTTADLKD